MNMNDLKKFNLQYKITIDTIDGNELILSSLSSDVLLNDNKKNNTLKSIKDNLKSPTIEFNINKQNNNSGNDATIIIHNLSYETRQRIYKAKISVATYRKVIIEAGYQDYTTTIFKGNISYCISTKQGEDIITTIYCNNSYSVNNSKISLAMKNNNDILQTLLKNMKNVDIGEITSNNNLFKMSSRGRSFNGNIWDIINQNNKDLDIFIDDEKVYILKNNDILKSNDLVLNANSGLLEITENDLMIEAKIVFEPLAKLCSKVILESEFNKRYNGEYKIIGLNHNVIISKIGSESQGTTQLNLNLLQRAK